MKIVLLPSEIATVLVEALPYIRQFAGKSVVVKLGGAAIDRESDLALAQDVLLLRRVGVSGEDAGLLTVTPADAALGFVGNVTGVRAELIHRLLDDGLTPVVSTVGANAEGHPYNVNADEAARAIAVAMNAEKIVYLTAAPGLLEDVNDETSLVERLTSAELRERLTSASVGKGMIPKLKACADAVDAGVNYAHIIDGRVQHSLLIELLTDHGVGTMIRKERRW